MTLDCLLQNGNLLPKRFLPCYYGVTCLKDTHFMLPWRAAMTRDGTPTTRASAASGGTRAAAPAYARATTNPTRRWANCVRFSARMKLHGRVTHIWAN